MAKQALNGKRANMFLMNPNDVFIVGLDTEDGMDHPLWDQRIKLPVSEQLMASIGLIGVSDPILVRKDGDDPIVVDGRQRVRAARRVNERRAQAGQEPILIPVIAQRMSELLAMATGESRNAIRQDDPVTVKAAKCQRYIALGGTPEEASIHFGVTRQTVYNWTKLDSVDMDVKKAVDNNEMSMTEAVKVASKPRKEQKEVAAKAKAAVEAGAPAKKRGRPKGGAPSRKVEVKRILAAVEAEPKKVLVHPEFAAGLRFALGLTDAGVAGVEEILKAAKKGKKG